MDKFDMKGTGYKEIVIKYYPWYLIFTSIACIIINYVKG